MTLKNISLVVFFLGTVIFAYLYFTKKCGVGFDTSNGTTMDSLQKFISYRQKDSSTIAEQNQIILKQHQAIESGALTEKALKKYIAQVSVKTRETVAIKIPTTVKVPPTTTRAAEYYDSARAAFLDSVEQKYPFLKVPDGYALLDTNQYHRVPRDIFKEDKWFTIKGTDEKEGLNLPLVVFRNEYTITIGSRGLGFFKKPKPLVLFENANPYSETVEMKNVVVKYKVPFYRQPWFIATATVIVVEGVRAAINKK